MERSFPVSGKIFVICLLVIILGGLTAASTTGWIDIKGITAQILPKQQEKNKQAAESLAEKNKRLQDRLNNLEKELQRERDLRISLEEKAGLDQKGTSGSEQKPDNTGYRALGEYYSGMKPSTAAAILVKLDLARAAEILRGMDKEEAGQILAAMEPERAAQLTEVMADSAAREDEIQ